MIPLIDLAGNAGRLEASENSKPSFAIHSVSISRLLQRRAVKRLLNINSARRAPEMVSTTEYQTLFKGYYRIRRGDQFCKPYFKLLRHHLKRKTKPTLKAIMLDLHKKTKERHLSFSSKLLATLDDSEPIYDKNVATLLHVRHSTLKANGWEEQVEERMDLLKRRLTDIISSPRWVKHEAAFNKAFPEAIHLSSLRKADLMLWASYVNPR